MANRSKPRRWDTDAELLDLGAEPEEPWHAPIRAVLRDKHRLEGLEPFRDAIDGSMVRPRHDYRVLYWNNPQERGIYLAREGAWVRTEDRLKAGSTCPVYVGDELLCFAEVLDEELQYLRIVTPQMRLQRAPLISLSTAPDN